MEPGGAIAGLGIPSHLAESLEQVTEQLISAAGDQLAAVVLYGSAARHRFREGQSDINLAVVLNDAREPILRAIAVPLEFGRRAAAVDPLVLTVEEVAGMADVFPIKVLEIQRHHAVLFGDNPFAGINVDRAHVRLRVEQQLRNLLLRLRRTYLNSHAYTPMLEAVLASAARKLAVDLQMLMMLNGLDSSGHDETSEQLAAAATALDLDAGVLKQIAALRRGSRPDDIQQTYARFLALLERVVAMADQLEA